MNQPLLLLLMTLTLLDLGFVQATDVVPTAELLPLWLLAAGTRWLRRLQRHKLYHAGWNIGVVAVFTLLVHHATTSGLLHMLEDGLVLAVLCQVHLLNNIGERQRPDLIFFNSFLIAFVTSFFTTDAVWSALFVAHAFVLVPSLQTYSLTRAGTPVPPALLAAVWRDCVPRTLAITAVTALAFVIVPRDFRRQGWIGDSLTLGQQFESGLADRIRIDDEHASHLPENVVARITPASGRPEDVPAHWRGTAFVAFASNEWSPQDAGTLGTRFATDPIWEQQSDGSLQRRLPGPPTRMVLQLLDSSAMRLPVPLAASHVTPLGGHAIEVNSRSDGTLRLLAAHTGDADGLRCTVDLAPASGQVQIAARTHAAMLALPDDVPDVVFDLVARLRSGADPTDALAVAHASCDWLQHNRRYQLPGQPGFAHNLGEFLLGSGAGHCEYFATALALVLRVQHVPCRLVGGWLAHEWDADTHSVVVRGKHAHAWVEVLDDVGRWHTFDATPAADVRAATDDDAGWFAAARRRAEAWWAAVTGFNQAARERWIAALLALPTEHPGALAALAAVLAGAIWLRRRQRQSLPSIAALHRAMRAAGVALQHGETTREMLARAGAADIEAKALARLQDAARQHEAARYATATTAAAANAR